MSRLAASLHYDYLTLCGDYNLPRIDWNSSQYRDFDGSYGQTFIDTIEDLNIYQHATQPTRFRGDQRSCLDLVFANEESMVDEVIDLPTIGKSDHICQKWEVTVSEVAFRNTTVLWRNFKRANWTNIKDGLRNFNIQSQDSPNNMNVKLIVMIDETKAQNVPFCRPRSVKYRLPWMRNAGIKKQRHAKWRSWKKYQRTGILIDYDAYKFERNRLNTVVRSAKMRYEQRLITDMKENPNLYMDIVAGR